MGKYPIKKALRNISLYLIKIILNTRREPLIMYKRRKIVAFLDEILEISDIEDEWYDNGLIIEGRERISSISFAVDPTKDIVKKAIEREYDMLITHHGIFYKKAPLRIKGNIKRKINLMIEHNLNYYVAHLPLDIHEEIGNAPNIIRKVGAKFLTSWVIDGLEIGAIGELKESMNFQDLINIFKKEITPNVIGMNFGSKKVSLICAVSTDIEDIIYDSIEFDAIILPSMDHISYQDAKEYGINVIYANQYDMDKIAFFYLKRKLLEEFPKLYIDFIEDKDILQPTTL